MLPPPQEAPSRDHWDYGPPARKMRRLDWVSVSVSEGVSEAS